MTYVFYRKTRDPRRVNASAKANTNDYKKDSTRDKIRWEKDVPSLIVPKRILAIRIRRLYGTRYTCITCVL